ncbi:GpE family phage tail protein [Achromobacter sp. UMC71]|nr:GpE family phage tail protein [Achromobacter sp. UMC71]
MADIALVFHWRPADMDGLEPYELSAWRERARVRYQPDKD